MKVKIFNGSLDSVEKDIKYFLINPSTNVKIATQSLNMESPKDPILTITVFYEQ